MKKSRIDYGPLYDRLLGTDLSSWTRDLKGLVRSNLWDSANGHLESWLDVLDSLPRIEGASVHLEDGLTISCDLASEPVEAQLKKLHPWRKGPIQLGPIKIDAEWRSDWKWDRLKEHLAPLKDRTVLDIGCGNGYYLYRMLGAGAKLAIGIDPFLLFVMQFWAIKHFAPDPPAWVLPLGWEDLPPELPHFDTVFSMGVLYHRRNPEEFIQQLQNYVRPGGELVLETLVIEGGEGEILTPQGRYAKMRNVWYIPTVVTLESALKQAGWLNVRCVDVTLTTLDEQRSTDWMHFESLKDFLDPANCAKTIEGHPAPRRAIILANKPG